MKSQTELQKLFQKLNTPGKIQDYLDTLPINFEEGGETYRSPRAVLRSGQAHCFEGACFAAAALHYNHRKGGRALLLDLKTRDLKKDADHVVALFRENGLWGAISKTNHPVLRFRDPIYHTVRELALSYFHEYFIESGQKTLISFSQPFNIIAKFGSGWIEGEGELDDIALALDKSKHYDFYPKGQRKFIRPASPFEVRATAVTEFNKPKNKNESR